MSVIVLIFAIASFLFLYLTQEDAEGVQIVAERPTIRLATPSQKETSLFFGVAMALFGVQIGMGMVTAHYAVEGDGFYGIPLQQYLPYAASRTWHLQLAVFWIATCWLAAGLYFAPRFGKQEPKEQVWGNSALLIALTLVVVGSLVGSWASVQGILTGNTSFLFGHQGYEYVELGRLWQLLLIGGMVFWLWLMFRALRPALKAEGSKTGEIVPERAWNEKLLRVSFWSLNGGLVAMIVLGLIPNGFYQLMQSVNHGTWYVVVLRLLALPGCSGRCGSAFPEILSLRSARSAWCCLPSEPCIRSSVNPPKWVIPFNLNRSSPAKFLQISRCF